MPVIYIYPYANRINSVPAGASSSENIYANVTALFHMDGNMTDSSVTSNNGGIVAPAVFSTSNKKFGTGSLYFDGNGGYAGASNTAGYSFGTGDFTVEAWVYPESLAGSGPDPYQSSTIVASMGVNNDGGGLLRWDFDIGKDGSLIFTNASEQSTPTLFSARTTANAVAINKWQHIAVTRQNGIVRFFVDGVLIPRTDAYSTSAAVNSNGPLRFGRLFTSNTWDYRYKGYLDEVRISKSARYTKNFDVPTTSFSSGYAALLMHMDGANNGTTFTDEYGSAITRTGNTITSSTNRKFGTASAYFDGTGDYLTTPVSSKFGFGAGDFTIDMWLNFADVSKMIQGVFDTRPNGNGGATKVNIVLYSNKITFCVGSTTRIQSTPITTNTWYHVAVSRKNGVTRMFVNGVQAGSDYIDTNDYGASNDIVFGALGDGRDSTAAHYQGYMDEIRVVKGEGMYAAAFTPPTIPFNTPTPSLLLQMDGPNDSTAFTDATGVTLNKFGDVKFSTDAAKFGISSIKFDGAGDYLTTPVSANYGFGLGDFTMEMWFNPINGGKTTGALMDMRDPGNWQAVKPTVILSANQLYFSIAGAEKARSAVLADNTWHHVAWSRVAGVSKFFVNGVMVGSLADANNYGTSSDIVFGQVSEARTTWDGYYFGYMDEIRIMKGVGMYSDNFTPPTSSF